MPARKQVGLVWINQTRSSPSGTSIRNVSTAEPPSNRSLDHAHLSSNVSALHALFLEHQHLLVTSYSLGLTGMLCLLDGSRPCRTLLFASGFLLSASLGLSLLCTTDLSKALGKLDRDAGGKILHQMPAVTHLSGLWSAFRNRRGILR